jgi:hypothetical protein
LIRPHRVNLTYFNTYREARLGDRCFDYWHDVTGIGRATTLAFAREAERRRMGVDVEFFRFDARHEDGVRS